jgi:hypothetical protein
MLLREREKLFEVPVEPTDVDLLLGTVFFNVKQNPPSLISRRGVLSIMP